MTTCIVLDGWHKGETVLLDKPWPTLRLLRPPVVTECWCNEEVPYISDVTTQRIDTLLLAFRSVDGEVALYSTDGKSCHILDRAWTQKADGGPFYREQELIYVGCRDRRAWDQP